MKQVAVQSISHEQDMALLRQEREHLKARCVTHTYFHML